MPPPQANSETSALHSPPESNRAPKIPIVDLRAKDTHRLIASKYSQSGTVLSRLSPNPATLGHLLELDDATNDRFLGEEGLLPGIGIHELVYGIRYAHIVNAAFTHASPSGGRFNSPTRGAWYASLDRATSIAEIAFHKLRALEEVDWPHEEISTSDDYLADITSPFHDLRDPRASPLGSSALSLQGDSPTPAAGSSPEVLPHDTTSPEAMEPPVEDSISHAPTAQTTANPFLRYLRPEPIPRCYVRPQRLADRLLAKRSNGILYPSVRRPEGVCLVVFRPALVYNVRRGARLELQLQRDRPFRASQAREVPVPQP